MNKDETPAEKFDRLFQFDESAFRLETLPSYKVGEDPDLQAYQAGEPIENMHDKDWCDNLQEWTSEGKTVERVRLIPESGSVYFNFEVEACYPHNVASGEEIYMLKEDEFDEQFSLPKKDVWLLDNETVLKMEYADGGVYQSCYYTDNYLEDITEVKSALIEASTEFTTYLKQRRKSKI